jgi:hypothetical protein
MMKNEITWHVARVGGKEKCIQGFCWGDLKEREQFEDLGVDG